MRHRHGGWHEHDHDSDSADHWHVVGGSDIAYYPGQHDDCIATTPHYHDRPYKPGDWSAEPIADTTAPRNDEWFHAAHGLHDEAHHQHHRPLDLCVPLWSDAAVKAALSRADTTAPRALGELRAALIDAKRLAFPFSLSPEQRERILQRIDLAIGAPGDAEG